MANIQLELSCTEGKYTGARRLQTFESSESVSVRDNSSRLTVTIKAAEISIYRHTLLIEGAPFKIVQIFK